MTEQTTSIAASTTRIPTSLTDLTRAWQWLEYKLLETGGEMDEELDRFYSHIGKHLSSKVDAYDHILTRLEAGAEFMKAEAKRFTAAAKAMEGHHGRLRDTLKFAMEQQGIIELQGERVRFKLSNAKASLEVDEGMVPLGPYSLTSFEAPVMTVVDFALSAHKSIQFMEEDEERELDDDEKMEIITNHLRTSAFRDHLVSTLDKEAVRADLEAGKELAFARLVPVKTLRRYAGGAK